VSKCGPKQRIIIHCLGEPINMTVLWTATDVQEGGQWKIRMLTALPKAPPPKQ
jgi:hypothetical protein